MSIKYKQLTKENSVKTLLYKIYKQRYLFLMLLPVMVLTIMFVYKPVIYWYIAFSDYKIGFNVLAGKWNGFQYFIDFFKNSMDATRVIKNTLYINIASLVVNLAVAIVFSILLNEVRNKRAKSVVQTFSLFPFFISWVVTYSLFQTMFSVNTGFVNTILMKYGILNEGINILGEAKYALGLMVFANLWKSLGYNAVIFLAAIAGIDQEQYESADIDGASRLQKIWHITAPSLSTTLAVLLILNSGWVLNSNFDQFYQFTNPTNLPSMDVLDMYAYRMGFQRLRYSYATVVGICKTLISLILLYLSNKIYRRLTGETVF